VQQNEPINAHLGLNLSELFHDFYFVQETFLAVSLTGDILFIKGFYSVTFSVDLLLRLINFCKRSFT
jgi:hypothetical protein